MQEASLQLCGDDCPIAWTGDLLIVPGVEVTSINSSTNVICTEWKGKERVSSIDDNKELHCWLIEF